MMLEQITVATASGPVSGRSKDGAWLFAGIPFAAPPLEDLRFKPPQPHPGWSAPYPAMKFGPAAPQVSGGGLTDSAKVRWSEDCLTLNISTPACDDQARAVLVWIHGGGYRTGQGSIPWYNGARFSRNGDIVVVSINYRLGALGFTDLSHLGDAYALSGVCGLLDQIAALRWVQENIAHFGGDPRRVTIAGESAGGFSVATLLGCPQAQDLFQRAIPQSGAAHHTLPPTAARKVASHFLQELGYDDEVALSAVAVEDILAAQTATIKHFEGPAGAQTSLGVAVSAFYPSHGNALLPEDPLTAIGTGCGSQIPVLTGTNTHETSLWGYGQVNAEKLQRMLAGYGAEAVLPTYQSAHPQADAEELLIAITTDHMFRIPAIRLAEARWPHTADTWMYLFNWHSRAFDGRLKATHALEIPFAFDNLDKAGVDVFIGPGERPQAVATDMHRVWTQFINGAAPDWAPYSREQRCTRLFDTEPAVVDDPASAERKAWDGLR